MRRSALLSAVAAVALAASAAPALAEPDMAAIQAQIDQMKADYEARIAALEARVAAAEARSGQTATDEAAPVNMASADETSEPVATGADEAAPVEEPVEVAAADAPAPASSVSLQNPGVSVILNGNYVTRSEDPAMARIPGFALAEETGPPERGFSLAESEVTLAANIDPFFYASLTFALNGEGEAEVEEAFIQTTALPGGFTAKAGRLFSGVGYLNERHAHNWSFIDMPLPYRAFLGGQYGDDGVQLRWLAPTDLFVEFGVEAFAGDGYPAGGRAHRGNGSQAAYVHTGGDISDSWSWLAAASWLHAEADLRETEDPVNGIDQFSGESDLGILSGVLKWAPGGNVKAQNLTLSAEYFLSSEDGRFNGVPVDLERTGWYVQGVFMFTPGWSAGVRYDRLNADDPGALLAGSTIDPLGNDPWSASALIEYDTSEFGRFRLQYTRDESGLSPVDLFWLQYTVAYGPHAAHRY